MRTEHGQYHAHRSRWPGHSAAPSRPSLPFGSRCASRGPARFAHGGRSLGFAKGKIVAVIPRLRNPDEVFLPVPWAACLNFLGLAPPFQQMGLIILTVAERRRRVTVSCGPCCPMSIPLLLVKALLVSFGCLHEETVNQSDLPLLAKRWSCDQSETHQSEVLSLEFES